MGYINRVYHILRVNARLVWFGVVVCAVSAVAVDVVDHTLQRAFNIGTSTGVWEGWPGRWLHDDMFVVGCVFLIIGGWHIFAFVRRLGNKDVLK